MLLLQAQEQGIAKCRHKFCSDCLNQYVVYKIGRFEPVTCPNRYCSEPIDQNCQCFKALPYQVIQKYRKFKRYQKVLKQPNIRMCPKQSCEGFVNLKHFDNAKKKQYTAANPRCDQCKTIYCYKCMLAYHEGSCEDSELEYFRTVLGYSQCSKCRRFIQKTAGCNHMKCPCGYHFCYKCGDEFLDYSHNCKQAAQPTNRQPLQPRQNCSFAFCRCICSFFCCKCNAGIQHLCSRPFFRLVYVLLWFLFIMPAIYIIFALFFFVRVIFASLFIGTIGICFVIEKYESNNNIRIKLDSCQAFLVIILFPLTLLVGIAMAMYQSLQEEKITLRYIECFPCENLGGVWNFIG